MSFRERMLARSPSPLSGLRIAVCLADEDVSTDWIPRHLSVDVYRHTWDYVHGSGDIWFDASETLPEHAAGADEAQRFYSMMRANHTRRMSDKLHDVVVMGSSSADMTKVIRPMPNTVYGRVIHHDDAMTFGLSTEFFFADPTTFTKVTEAFRYLPDIRKDALRVSDPTGLEAFYYHCCQIGIEVEPI